MPESLLPSDPVAVDYSKITEDLDKIQFDFSSDESRGKLIITAHGEKGAGKTTAVFLITTGRIGGFPSGKTNVISFDNKSKITKEQYFPMDDITVWNGKQHYREDPDLCTKSGMISYKYIQKLIQSWRANPPDWIVFDGFTIMSVILEMAMRFKHGLQPSQGIANLNVWKDRARFIQDLHNLACNVAKYGVAYTTYSEKNEIVEAGTTISKTDVPKYIDVIMQETDVVLHATKAKGKDGDLFYLRVESTKFKSYVDMDGKPIPEVVTTLKQGRTFDISKSTDLPAAKRAVQPVITEKMKDMLKPVEKPVEKFVEKLAVVKPETTISKLIETPKPAEQAKPIEAAKPAEVAKPIEEAKPIVSTAPVVKMPEIPKPPPSASGKKTNFVIPDLLSI
jgi:hypothetical protein